MSERKLVSVEEYSRLKGISKTTVYSMLKGSLANRLVVKNGIKYIDISEKNEEDNSNTIETHKTEDAKKTTETNIESESFVIVKYEKEIEQLRKELEDERKHSRDKDNKLLEMMDRVIKLTENTQILTARVQEQQSLIYQERKLLEDNTKEQKKGLLKWIKDKWNNLR